MISRMWSTRSGTTALIAVSVVLFILDTLTNHRILLWGAVSSDIWAGEWWRLIAPNFIHSGITHIAFNMYALYIFGRIVEGLTGRNKFLVVFFISGLCGFAMSLLANPDTLAVGASAGIFGLMGYTLHFRIRRLPLRLLPMDSAFLQIFVLNLIVAFFVPNIDHWAHFGGLVGGILTGGIVGLPVMRRGFIVEGVIDQPPESRSFVIAERALATLFIASLLYFSLAPMSFANVIGNDALKEVVDTRYGVYLDPFRAVGGSLFWRDANLAGDEWKAIDQVVRRENPRARLQVGLFWRWEAGSKQSPHADWTAQWQRLLVNGQWETVHTDTGRVTEADPRRGLIFLRSMMTEMSPRDFEGEWQVRVLVNGRPHFSKTFTLSSYNRTI